MELGGKTAIITGAANGLGKATAIKLAGAGARVALVDIDRESLCQVKESILLAGGEAREFVVDITQKPDIKAAVAEILSTFGAIDILVNNAGIGWQHQAPFKDIMDDSWEKILDLNIKGTLYFTHAVLGHLAERRYGKIVNIASIAAKVGIANLAAYSASKGAMVSFTKALAMEMGPYNVNVNCISPGLVSNDAVPPPSNGTYLGRKGTTEEMASLIVFIASDEASYITGANYLIDGGRTLGPKGI
ncbi:MAG: SDR family oxidoreductase [Planctomycetes bacterium]|nr:SDR family oxidoreductase [Planctomycetota bacterium]